MGIDGMLASIPYVASHAVEVVALGEDVVELRLPFRREVTNYVGTLHAGALFTAAETAAGVAAYRIVPGERAIVLLGGARVRYARRAEGDVVATARVESGHADAGRKRFEAEGRAEACVEVTIADASGAVVFDGTFDYALRPRRS